MGGSPHLQNTSIRAKRRRPLWLRIIPLVFMAIVLGAGCYVGYVVRHTSLLQHLLHNPTVASEFPGISTMNVMIIGRDYDYDNKDRVIKTHARSDMLMVGRLDFTNNTVRLLSIPRDTHARIPGRGFRKINVAHAIGGPMLSAQTITRNFGIPIDHYVALDIQGFENAIDLMKGVDVNVDRKMDYDDDWGHLHIHLTPGFQHLTGQQAMGYVRFRHADSDLVRTTRQQALVAAIKSKMLMPTTLMALPSIINTIDEHVDSDLNADQKIAVAHFIRSAPKQNITMLTLPSIEGSSYVYTDWAAAAPLIQSMFGVTPPPNTDRHRAHRLTASRLHGSHRVRAAIL